MVCLCEIIFYVGRWIGQGQYPLAGAVVASAFLLLITGAAISWYKPALLDIARLVKNTGPASAID
ncbi:MAG: hypothetical protein ACYTF1_15520 [Planctomycetota bacterium]